MLLHWQQARQSKRTWHDYPQKSCTAVIHGMITRDLECPWHDYCIPVIFSYDTTGADFEKFTVHFQSIRKEIVSSMYNNTLKMKLIKIKIKKLRRKILYCTSLFCLWWKYWNFWPDDIFIKLEKKKLKICMIVTCRRKEGRNYTTKLIIIVSNNSTCFHFHQGHFYQLIPTMFVLWIYLLLMSFTSHIIFIIFQSVLDKNIHKLFITKILYIWENHIAVFGWSFLTWFLTLIYN